MTKENPQGTFPYVWRPQDVEAAWAIKQHFGEDACYVAGGTLLQLQWEAGTVPKHLISLEGIQALGHITESEDEKGVTLDIGPLCRLSTCKEHPLVLEHWPLLAFACSSVGAPAIRNRATLGGNVANGHGDALTALLALDAELVWFDGDRVLTPASILIQQASANPYDVRCEMSFDSTRLLTGIRLHRPADLTRKETQRISIFRKLGRRAAFVPSLLTVAASCERKLDTTDKAGSTSDVVGATAASTIADDPAPLTHVRLSVGAIDFQPRRLTETERWLEGAIPRPDLWQRVHAQIMAELDPPDTRFASAEYRRLAVANVLVAELATACARPVKEEIEC